MAPFLWLRGDEEVARKLLVEWPEELNATDYVWQRSLQSGQRKTENPTKGREVSRLDYMLLRQLFDVGIRR